MQKHTNRVVVAAVLVAAGVIGGFFVVDAHRRAANAEAASAEISRHIDRMIATAADIGATQAAYVAPGQPDRPWLERGAMLLQQFGEDAAALRPMLQDAGASLSMNQVDQHFKSIVVVDGNARQSLQQSQGLLAADLVFSEGRTTISALVEALKSVAASEEARGSAERAGAEGQQWIAIGAIAALWILGLIALAPAAREPDTAVASSTSTLSLQPPSPAQAATTVDLAAAAAVCGALARTPDTASLRNALARAAAVLDARGLIVWMGAGEELFPALSHGYEQRVVERLGPIARNAENATAEAWRTAQMRTVASDVMSNGAVVVPVTGVSGCVGVLAAEMRHGREEDPATRAVAAMIAAQLAAIVSAWPGASSASPDVASSGPLAASGN